ncbi:PcfJ domain-containing protein [Seonamhaeicola sp. ML3]|uniref:PcfJ domain-containing protein n=1 Tax=Seonamhaeicola sp. ML3 TaxID=2937786 RepID=UPI00200C6AD0|nr:PcfJ domain-containing protein [Seonamhaeicola sp. ML3]
MKTIWNTKSENTKHSTYVALVEQVYNEENKPQRYKGTVESMLREFFSKTSKKKYTWKRKTFRALLLQAHSDKCYAVLRNYNYVKVLHNISSFGNKLVRPVEAWENKRLDPTEQISSLITHCFAKYEAPKFLENTFYGFNNLHMLWYVQLGKGASVLSLSQFPVTFTHKMAHVFRSAPPYFYVNQAIRYAQAVGFGAKEAAAKVIAHSDLANTNENHEVFWSSVVQFFAKVECLESNEINHIQEYLAVKYYEDQSFSMKGRTFNALLNQANEWHRKKHFENGNVLQWEASGIPPLFIEEELNGCKVVYKTIELKNSYELYEEGEAMKHCVADYDDDCFNKQSAIFSLQKEVMGQPAERLATLEIGLPDRHIVQAKAKYNEEPCSKALTLIDSWVNNESVKRYSQTVAHVAQVQEPYEPVVYQRLAEREQMNNYNWDANIVWIIKLIFWIFYILFVVTRSYKSQSNNYSVSPQAWHEWELETPKIDSILKASYQVNWPDDSLKINLKVLEEKWQNLN